MPLLNNSENFKTFSLNSILCIVLQAGGKGVRTIVPQTQNIWAKQSFRILAINCLDKIKYRGKAEVFGERQVTAI